MNVVARFESFIERLMERTLTRTSHSHLQPVEIGKRLVRAMESEQAVGMNGVLVPNVYDVYLSHGDYVHFQPMRRSLTTNMEAHVARVARQRKYELVSKPVVRLNEDARLSSGDLRVECHLQDVDASAPDYQHTAMLPNVGGPLTDAPTTPNLVVDGKRFAVLRSPTRVGRLPDNDIVLNDKRVSRYHAEFLEQGRRWMMRDIGSTNGTAVNGRIVRESALKPGDRVSLGGLEVTWEQ